tara:strand:- start:68 stop:253 length:186 start_codon:yes stop_codon:yes gene_type:complete
MNQLDLDCWLTRDFDGPSYRPSDRVRHEEEARQAEHEHRKLRIAALARNRAEESAARKKPR